MPRCSVRAITPAMHRNKNRKQSKLTYVSCVRNDRNCMSSNGGPYSLVGSVLIEEICKMGCERRACISLFAFLFLFGLFFPSLLCDTQKKDEGFLLSSPLFVCNFINRPGELVSLQVSVRYHMKPI